MALSCQTEAESGSADLKSWLQTLELSFHIPAQLFLKLWFGDPLLVAGPGAKQDYPDLVSGPVKGERIGQFASKMLSINESSLRSCPT